MRKRPPNATDSDPAGRANEVSLRWHAGPGVALVALALAVLIPAAALCGVVERKGGHRTLTATAGEARSGIELPDLLVIADSDSVFAGEERLARGVDYEIDHRRGVITVSAALPDTATVTLTYLYLPLELERTYRHAVLESLAALPEGFADDAVLVSGPAEPPAPDGLAHGLRIGGAKTFGITVGSNRDPSLEQSLRMNISGRVTRNVSVNAYLSDQNTPLVPEGDTEELRALDKVLIEIEGENVAATMGDYELRIDGGPLADFRREETGALVSANRGRLGVMLAGARSAGEFMSATFRGVDGKQGPYLLTGRAGETGVTVVAGSERVWLDGVRLTRGRDNDYVIDYSAGSIEFTETRPVVNESEITVDYEFMSGDYRRDTYAGRATLAGRDGASSLGVSFFREVDDRDAASSAEFSSSELAVLAAAGDDAELAHDDGVDSVGVGNGDYVAIEEGIFEYAGPDSGDYDLNFERDPEGDYVYDFIAGHYEYVGAGEGEYRLGRGLPLPTDHGLVVTDGRLALGRDGFVELSGGLSSFDRNTFSSLDDGDNLGNAQVLEAALPRIEPEVLGGGALGLSVGARRVAGGFRGVGRFRELGYAERWELQGLALPEGETLVEGASTLTLGGGGTARVSHAYLERGDVLESAKTEFRLDGRPTTGGRVWADGRAVDLRYRADTDSTVERSRLVYRGGLEQAVGFVKPGVRYGHDERTSDGRGERYDEYGASVENARTGSVSFLVSYAHRLTDRSEDSEWSRAATTVSQEYRLGFDRWEKLQVEGRVVRREVEFEEGFDDPASRYDLASVRLNHGSMNGGLTGEVRYSVTSTEVEEKERFVTEEDGVEITRIVGTGTYLPVTDLTASTKWKLKPGSRGRGGRGKRALPEPTALGRFLSAMTFTSDLKLRETTTTDDKRSLYLLDPGVIQGDDTVRGEITGRHVARYLAANNSLSVRLALTTRDALDRIYVNEHTRRKERSGTADVKLSPSGGVTYRVQGDLGMREQDGTGGDTYDIDERSLLGEASARRLGDLELRLTASAAWQDEAESGIGVTVVKVTPSVTWRLAGRGALSASVTRFEVEASGGSLDEQPYLAEGRREGRSAEWRVTGDYRFNRYLTGSLSYVGEARADAEPRHTVDVNVSAFF